jgi:ABC-2 type transport system permease protein
MTCAALPVRFALHELRLAWRDLIAMLTAGKRQREGAVLAFLILIGALMHAFAYSIVAPYAGLAAFDRQTLVIVTGFALLSWTLMMSQAMESVTRAFFARADLDLLLSSPMSPGIIFALRIVAIALTTMAMAALLVAPFVNVLIFLGGMRWISAYAVVAGMSLAAVALSLALTTALFGLIGARRTRLVSQIVAAVIGAAFAVGVQVVSIYSYGNLSRLAAFHSDVILALAPGLDSLVWLPARASMGDRASLAWVVAATSLFLALTILFASGSFAQFAAAAAGLSLSTVRQRPRRRLFDKSTPAHFLRRKEWTLLARDPWLASQTLMQLLYLLPPALLLWRNFRAEAGSLTLLAPVLVMAAGQLAGGLAWLAISGEDAPELVATSPVTARAVMRAKIEAVIAAVMLPISPFALALAFASPRLAVVTLIGVVAAAGSATAIQIFFRSQARRRHFRSRQTSSRAATFAEALSSINWAATAGLAAAGSWLAAVFALMSIGVLAGARLISPRAAEV